MSASTSDKINPDTLALRAQPRPVTRLNRRTLVVGAGVLCALVLGATFWSLGSKHPIEQGQSEQHSGDKVAHAEGLDTMPSSYADAIPVLGKPLPGDWGKSLLQSEQRDHAGETPTIPAPRDTAAEAARSDRARQWEQVVSAPLLFKTSEPRSDSASARPAPTTASPSLPFGFAAPGGNPATTPGDQNLQEHKQAYLDKATDQVTHGSGTLLPPSSPYTIMAGTIISAALVTGIDSDLPGKIIATVTEPVYDTATGASLLVPQGSRLMGSYDSQVAFGQRRTLVVWTRLIMPDTSSITLDRLPAVDPAGYAGLEDGVNWHWGRIFAGAAVSTLIGVGAEIAAPDQNSGDGRVVIATRESVEDTVNQAGQEITKRNLNIQPTLTERPGLPMRVIVNKDLMLRPYQPLFFQYPKL